MRAALCTLILFVALCPIAYASEFDNFCNNPQTWEHFNTLVEKKTDDVSLQILHALKIGLCKKIQDNSITTSEAIQLFNDMVDAAAIKKGEDRKQEEL